MIPRKKTKIIATIGPASEQEKTLEKLISIGVDCTRLNFSHGSHQEKSRNIKLIRSLAKKLKKQIAIIADIQGPKIRIGNLPENGIELKNGQEISIDTGTREYYGERIPLPSLMFRDGTKEGHLVFLDDGNLQIKITSKYGGIFKAIVIKGGVLFSKKGVNVPDLDNDSSILNAKDKADIEFAVRAKADYLAVSFIRTAKDLKSIKKFLGKSKIKIIAKIERPEALINIEEIIDEADAIMIARGDLGIETPLWELPIRQKEIIESVRKKTKPVIVATQMLDSMIRNPIPTRAEVSDVANAVFESTDAVMLSGETASGKYPIEAVDMMRKILEATSENSDYPCDNFNIENDKNEIMTVAKSAVEMAIGSQASAIIIGSADEALATAVSSFRPNIPIIAITKKSDVAQLLALTWGVTPLITANKNLLVGAKKILLEANSLKKGEKITYLRNIKTTTIETI